MYVSIVSSGIDSFADVLLETESLHYSVWSLGLYCFISWCFSMLRDFVFVVIGKDKHE